MFAVNQTLDRFIYSPRMLSYAYGGYLSLVARSYRRYVIGKAYEQWARLDRHSDVDECYRSVTHVPRRIDRHCSYTGAQWTVAYLSGGKLRVVAGKLITEASGDFRDVAFGKSEDS